MSRATYDAGTMTITVDGPEDAERTLGDLEKKTPTAAKVAINATARQAKKLMVAQAKTRYAMNAAGWWYLRDLVQWKKATNTSLSVELHIEKMRNDLGYLQYRPTENSKGRDVLCRAPAHVKARVLKSSAMIALTGNGANLSKGFLVGFKNGRVGMVQRHIGSSSSHTVTERGRPRQWNKDGKVEKLVTIGSPSVTAMHSTVWSYAESEATEYLYDRLMERTERVIVRAKARKGQAMKDYIGAAKTAGIGWTPQLCQDALTEMLEELFTGKKYNGQQGRKPLKIYKQDLPVSEDYDANVDMDAAAAPYIVARMIGRAIKDESGPQTMEFSLIVCVYDEDGAREGYQNVANIKEDIVQQVCMRPYFDGAFTTLKPVVWAMQQDDTHPYYFGACTLTCTAPAMTQDMKLEGLV